MARWNSGESRLPAAAPADTLVARYLRRAHSGFCTCPLAVTNTAIISEAFLADLFSFLLMPFRGPFSRVSKLSPESAKMSPNFRETLAVRRLPSLQPSPATSFSLIVLSVSFYFSETRCRLYQHRFLQPNTHFATFFETSKMCILLHTAPNSECCFVKHFAIFVPTPVNFSRASR